MRFKNITNPDMTPVDGDTVSYNINGREVITSWDWNVLVQLLKIANKTNTITKLEFRRLFPQSAIVAIDNFEYNLSLSDIVKAQLRSINASFSVAESIDLSDVEIEQALSFYVSLEFMTEPEKLTVLTSGHG